MVRTRGLTHLALAVRDPERSFRFYERVLGFEAQFRREEFVQARTPGTHEAVVFQRDPQRAGAAGGILHFGFRLVAPEAIADAVRAVEEAGGRITAQGEFCPGEPYLFFLDPDGYEIEIWFEPE